VTAAAILCGTMSEEEKIDISTLTEEERAIYTKYGKLPKQNELIKKRNAERLKGKARFDSADWELKKREDTGDGNTPKGEE